MKPERDALPDNPSNRPLKKKWWAYQPLQKPLVPIFGTRELKKADMRLNDYLPTMEVDPETYEVRADGQLLTCEPAKTLPMSQRYFLF